MKQKLKQRQTTAEVDYAEVCGACTKWEEQVGLKGFEVCHFSETPRRTRLGCYYPLRLSRLWGTQLATLILTSSSLRSESVLCSR